MKHLTLEGEIVFEIFTKIEKKKEERWCRRCSSDKVIVTSSLEHYGEPIETEVNNKEIFMTYVYYYGRDIAYDKLKEINFKFE